MLQQGHDGASGKVHMDLDGRFSFHRVRLHQKEGGRSGRTILDIDVFVVEKEQTRLIPVASIVEEIFVLS